MTTRSALRAIVAVPLAALFALALSSCPKKAQSSVDPAGPAGTEDLGAQDVSETRSGGFGGSDFVIRSGAGFYELKDGEIAWKDSLSLGQAVEITGAAVKASFKKVDYQVLPVKLESGADGYVIESDLAVDASMAVVVSDLATLYKQAKETAVLSTVVPPRTVLAAWPVQGAPDFYRILGIDPYSGQRYADRFLAATDLSLGSDDVNVALLLSAVKSVPKKEQKRKLLETITTKYPASAFSSVVQEIQIALEPEKMGTVALDAEYVSVEGGVVRDIPSEYGAVVEKFAAGKAFKAAEATSERFKVGEDSAPWIRVDEPAGWIFGNALSEKKD